MGQSRTLSWVSLLLSCLVLGGGGIMGTLNQAGEKYAVLNITSRAQKALARHGGGQSCRVPLPAQAGHTSCLITYGCWWGKRCPDNRPREASSSPSLSLPPWMETLRANLDTSSDRQNGDEWNPRPFTPPPYNELRFLPFSDPEHRMLRSVWSPSREVDTGIGRGLVLLDTRAALSQERIQ